MALLSPRFTDKSTFNHIDSGSLFLRKGSRNNTVQIVQQALRDLGFKSSQSDGIYGINTEWAVQQFQRAYQLDDDGIVGSQTLAELDRALPGFQHRVRLHFRSINLTNVTFARIFSSTERVYAQYGIKIEMASGKSLLLTPEQTNRFFWINESCAWTIDSGELHELQGMGGSVPSNEILVYYVNRFDDSNLLGCGGHANNRPAATIASHGHRYDTAHEVGHVLLTSHFSPVHSGKTSNLMYAYSVNNHETPVLENKQLDQMRSSVCCVSV